MKHSISFERAVFNGDIKGPRGVVTDEAGEILEPGEQYFGHTRPGRNVCLRKDGSLVISSVIDFQSVDQARPRWSPFDNFYEDGQVICEGSVL